MVNWPVRITGIALKLRVAAAAIKTHSSAPSDRRAPKASRAGWASSVDTTYREETGQVGLRQSVGRHRPSFRGGKTDTQVARVGRHGDAIDECEAAARSPRQRRFADLPRHRAGPNAARRKLAVEVSDNLAARRVRCQDERIEGRRSREIGDSIAHVEKVVTADQEDSVESATCSTRTTRKGPSLDAIDRHASM